MDPIIERLARLAPSTLGHFVDEGFLDIAIRPVFRPVKFAGRALTVDAPPRDNAIYRRAINAARPRDVLVIARGGDYRHASFGGGMALAAKNRGVAGVVVDGPATDRAELIEFGLPVFSRGLSALTTRRLDLGGSVGEPIVCGGVRVVAGDYVLADDDGVLVIPASDVESIVERGEAAARREQETLALLKAGKTFEDIDAMRRET